MKKKSLLMLLLSIMCLPVWAQTTINVSGVVKDKATGESVIGASVQVEGTSHATITDVDGKFRLNAIPVNSILVFTYVGMKMYRMEVENGSDIVVELEAQAKGLDEIVVVGYGTSRKRDLTGSIVSLKGDDLKTSPDYNPVKALQGKVPGLVITNSGAAGGSPSIRIRGVGTTFSGTDPLYIVDGMFLDNIDFVNPSDITSIEVLKDPSSLAIFGVQGANGVIIITTKRAEKGRTMVSYDGYGGVQYLQDNDKVKLTNASEFTMLYNEQLKNMNSNVPEWTGDLLGKGSDWLSYIIRPAMITNHGVTLSNSSDKVSSVLSIGYFKQDGIVKYNSYQRFNGRWALDYNVSKFFKAGGNVNLSRWNNTGATASVDGAVKALPTYAPYAPESDYDPNNIGSKYTPSPGIQKDVANPVAAMEIYKGTAEGYGYRGVGNIYAELRFLNDFTLRATGYGDVGVSYGSNYTPRYDVNNSSSNSSYRSLKTSFDRNTAEYTKYQSDVILNYSKAVDKHRISAMAGFTARLLESKGFNAGVDTLQTTGSNWNVGKDFWMLSMGSDKNRRAGDWYSAESFVSYLTRATYSFNDKYLATLTFRADASSKFSPKNRWGYFPSIGLGWVISDEEFFESVNVIDYLKMRGSWGKIGNDKIGNYLYFPSINPKGQMVVVNGKVYYLPTQDYLVDENIHWEVVSGLDAGFESRLFNDKLAVDLGFYSKNTNDMLARVSPPVSVGAGYAITNAGSLRNTGIEFMVSWKDKLGKFGYSLSINGAYNKNEVTALGNDDSDIISGDYHRTSVGHPVGSIYGYVQDGIFQNQAEIDNYYPASWISKPGDIRYKDLDGDKKITDADRTFIGQTIPTFTYGGNIGFNFMNFDLGVEFNGVHGNQIVNTKKLPGFSQFNFYQTALNRWHGEGTSNTEPILATDRSHNILASTNLLESGTYVRIRSLQLGYNVAYSYIKSLGINKLRIYANVQNLYTFHKNTGFTPEIGGGILDGSVDSGGTYPIPTVYTAGLTINF